MKISTSILTALVAVAVAGCGDDTGGSTSGGGSGGGTGATTTTGAAVSTGSGTSQAATTSANSASATTGGSGGGEGGGGGDTTSVGGGGGGAGEPFPGQACGEDVPLPPDEAPSGGECITIGGAVECNPITNEPCLTDEGEACDLTGGGFTCYPANSQTLCESCNLTDQFCLGGMTCPEGLFDPDFGPPNVCTRFCCDDSDCGAEGTCSPFEHQGMTLGFCFDGPIPE